MSIHKGECYFSITVPVLALEDNEDYDFLSYTKVKYLLNGEIGVAQTIHLCQKQTKLKFEGG